MLKLGPEICHVDRCQHGCTSATGCKGIEGARHEWENAQRISDLPEVDAAIRSLIDDPTGDNATCMVRAILRSAAGVLAQPTGKTTDADGVQPSDGSRAE